jgi:PAS domain S-box-containing protein
MSTSVEQQIRSLTDAQRFAAIIEYSDDAIISKELNGIITTWNPGAERIFGYSAEEVIGKPITILIPPDRQDEEPFILNQIRRGERVDYYETVRRRKDGAYIDISLTVSPIKDVQGNITGASKIARDITERKRTDAQIATLAREAEHRAKNLLAVVQAVVSLSQSSTPEGSRPLLMAGSGRSRTSMTYSSSRAGPEPTYAIWSRKSYRLTCAPVGTWALKARWFCYSARLLRLLPSLFTSWRQTPLSMVRCSICAARCTRNFLV